MPREYIIRSKEEKLAIVKRNLAGESTCVLAKEIGCNDRQVRNWVKKYQEDFAGCALLMLLIIAVLGECTAAA